MTVPEAVEVFVRAFCMGKSATFPYLPVNLLEGEGQTSASALWSMQDAPERKKDRRKAEVVSFGLDPSETVRRTRDANVGWHFLCVVQEPGADFEGVKSAYKEFGYRALGSEKMYVHDLAEIPEFDSAPPVIAVADLETAANCSRLAERQMFRISEFKQILLPFRQYAVVTPEDFVGRVRSVPLGKDAWVSDLYVAEKHRNNGFGKALMSRLLQDDKGAGVENSVLLASRAGSRIYPALGYRERGIMQVFCPRER